MSRHTKDKRKKAKLEKQQQAVQAELEEQQVKFDILRLLRDENTSTKPNMAKFLKAYVKDIRGFNPQKISFYPSYGYKLSKIIVKFLDGHDLIYDMCPPTQQSPNVYLYYKIDEEDLKDNEQSLIEEFFKKLLDFKFVF